jgi:hypothetical protein
MLLSQGLLPFDARVEAVTVVDVQRFKPDVEYIHKIRLGETPVVDVFLEDVLEDGVVDVPNFRVKFFPAPAVGPVILMDGVGVLAGAPASAVVVGII